MSILIFPLIFSVGICAGVAQTGAGQCVVQAEPAVAHPVVLEASGGHGEFAARSCPRIGYRAPRQLAPGAAGLLREM